MKALLTKVIRPLGSVRDTSGMPSFNSTSVLVTGSLRRMNHLFSLFPTPPRDSTVVV